MGSVGDLSSDKAMMCYLVLLMFLDFPLVHYMFEILKQQALRKPL